MMTNAIDCKNYFTHHPASGQSTDGDAEVTHNRTLFCDAFSASTQTTQETRNPPRNASRLAGSVTDAYSDFVNQHPNATTNIGTSVGVLGTFIVDGAFVLNNPHLFFGKQAITVAVYYLSS